MKDDSGLSTILVPHQSQTRIHFIGTQVKLRPGINVTESLAMDYHPLYAMNTYTRVCSEMDKKVKKDEKEKRLYIYVSRAQFRLDSIHLSLGAGFVTNKLSLARTRI